MELASLDTDLRQRPALAQPDRQPSAEHELLLARDGTVQKDRDRAVGVLRPAAGALHVAIEQRDFLDLATLRHRQPVLEKVSRGRRHLGLEEHVHPVLVKTKGQRLVGGGAWLVRPGRNGPVDLSGGQAVGDLRDEPAVHSF